MSANLSAAAPVVEGVLQPPDAVDAQAKQAQQDDHPQIEAAQKILELGRRVQKAVPAHILPGDQVHAADGFARQLEFHRAHDVPLGKRPPAPALDERGKVVVGNEADALAAAIMRMLSDPSLVHQLSENIKHQFGQGEVSWPVIADKYIKIYEVKTRLD